MAVCATLSLEGGPIFWVATHRVHHQLSDREGDPHTPREGGWWAHLGWIVWGNALHAQTNALARYVPDLSRDRFYLWLSNTTGFRSRRAACCCSAWAGSQAAGGMPWGCCCGAAFCA